MNDRPRPAAAEAAAAPFAVGAADATRTTDAAGAAAAPAPPDPARLRQAVDQLRAGGLVAFPTETVYGLGADAEDSRAVARIYAAKGRPADHPLIVHVTPDADLAHWASEVPEEARRLAAAFWPGPLTMVLKRGGRIDPAVSGGLDTIGLRSPGHPVALALLAAFAAGRPGGQGGLAGPSANRFGHVSPTRSDHVRAEFPDMDEDALLVLEGGASAVGIESTIVDLSRLDQGVGPALLRPGAISADQLAEVLGRRPQSPDAGAPRVSGSLKAHYAPQTRLACLPRAALLQALAAPGGGRTAAAVFPPWPPEGWRPAAEVEIHHCSLDVVRYARELYALLRELDEGGYDRLLFEAPPSTPEWQAVNDRLGRAAAAFD